MSNYQWYFPVNAEGGQPEGLNDSGVESFRGNQIESLAREIIQNSTDAVIDKRKPVKVSFKEFKVSKDEFPDRTGLTEAFSSALSYKRTPEQAKNFFSKGVEILNQNEFSFLKISDYNTTGLYGVNEEGSDWENLVKSVGISNKGGSSGGSFGIGKSAPFACSNLRTVFYSTLNEAGEQGFQGVSRLASHKKNGRETRGTGFYGKKELTKPITAPNDIPGEFRRTEIGTDVYVASFLKDEEWKEKIIKAVIENFFIAITEKQLIVEVGDIEINDIELKSLIDTYIQPNNNFYADQYYSSFKLGEKYHGDIEGLGTVHLYIKKDEEYSKRVAMVRNTGMKITHLDRFRGGSKFSGTAIIKGEELNQILRKTEPPTHDKWEPSRYDDEKYAKKIIKKVHDFIRTTVKEINKADEGKKIDFKGFNQFLPDHLNEEDPLEENNVEQDSNKFVPKTMKISERRNKKKSRATLATKNKKKKNNGENKQKPRNEKGGASPVGGHKNQAKRLNVSNVRSIVVGGKEGIYDIKITTTSGGKGKVSLNFIGEDAKAYKAKLLSAVDTNTGESVPINESEIGPVKFEDKGKKTIRIELDEKLRASLEVLVNEG